MDRPHVVSFNGELDIWKETEVEARLAVLDGSVPVVIDLSAVRYLDSAFLSALVRLRRRLPACSITLVAQAPSVRRVFELTEMHRLFEIVRTAPSRPEDEG
ncbi:MAG TPA: STAS domain-containing protein [Candidatus Elarobacter sp.]